MLYKCKLLSSLVLSNFNTQNITNMKYMFYKCKSLSSLVLSEIKIDKFYSYILSIKIK